MGKPVVFISSSCEDLEKTRHRAEARQAALRAGLFPDMQEYWPAKDNPPLKECLARVEQAEVLVVMVAHRFGWIPGDQAVEDPNERKSITWLECEHAVRRGREVLAFLVDGEAEWPAEVREDHELVKAVQEERFTAELGLDIQWRVSRLKAFKAWLSERALRETFTSPDDLRGKVESALHQWKQRHHLFSEAVQPASPDKYLHMLLEETSYIDIRGLKIESGEARRLLIDELYIPLKTTLASDEHGLKRQRKGRKPSEQDMQARTPIELHHALKNRRLIILGDPGMGKTTFLRRIAMGLCNSRLGFDCTTTAETLGLEDRPFPLLIRIAKLADHIEAWSGRRQGEPSSKTSPAWLTHFLGIDNAETQTGLDQAYFETLIENGPVALLMDGLDETATRRQREDIAELVTEAARCFPKCQFVVASRPPAFAGRSVPPDFQQVWIDPLEDQAIEGFLKRWCEALFTGSEHEAEKHRDELLHALQSRREIRRMARNPVMLTALAVVHWHEKRLPEQRADLYESILTWLSRSREKRVARLPAEVCINRLQELALAMQTHEEGRQVQVSRRWAAERIAPEWPSEKDKPQRQRIEVAETFLQEEELDSGIVVARGDDIAFWHLTFQEYLAARAIGARSEKEQQAIVWSPADRPALYLPEWREVLLLLGGVLHKQGVRKVDGFVSAVLERVGGDSDLADQARCAGLLGAMMQDLSAVKFVPSDKQYEALLDRVMAIFDRNRPAEMEIKVVIEAAEALGRAGDPRFSAGVQDSNWEDIPAGEFLMGAQQEDSDKPNHDSEAYGDESPVHPVTLAAYRIGRYPVTVTEYRRFVEAEAYANEAFWKSGGFGKWQEPEGWADQLEYPNRPIVGVSWFEAAAYAQWAGGRLPTEAEWERAARGAEGRRYPWGNSDPDESLLNYAGNIGCSTPVGIYPQGATPEGILDMAGNVDEWCSDGWDDKYYGKSPKRDPQGPSSGSSRVLRGGAWDRYPWSCRCSYRYFDVPSVRSVSIGFRLVSLSFGLGLPS